MSAIATALGLKGGSRSSDDAARRSPPAQQSGRCRDRTPQPKPRNVVATLGSLIEALNFRFERSHRLFLLLTRRFSGGLCLVEGGLMQSELLG